VTAHSGSGPRAGSKPSGHGRPTETPGAAARQRRASPADVREAVAGIIADVRARGDVAVREYSERFDRWSPPAFRLERDEIERIVAGVPAQVRDDISVAQANIRAFAQAQRDSLRDFEVETMPGVFLGQRNIPVAAAGAYIPGGRIRLSRRPT
jgi:sulfopropanediol 3-dehydrogenase